MATRVEHECALLRGTLIERGARTCFRVQSNSGNKGAATAAESFEKTTTMPKRAYATVKSCEYQCDGEKSP